MNQKEIEKVIKLLNSGGIIAYPTDTLYGIGCDATNQKAVEKVFEIKGRDFSKPMSIACSSVFMASNYVKISDEVIKLLKEILPGPYTVLLPRTQLISDLVTAGSNLVGLRIPDHMEILELIEKYGKPIITTSANLSGKKDVIKYDDIILPVDYIVKGKCKYDKPSTVFDPIGKKIIREGANVQIIKNLLSN